MILPLISAFSAWGTFEAVFTSGLLLVINSNLVA
jgi:mannitol-specific phosphotransferase system IIBC component